MKTIILSNHTETKLAEMDALREEDYRKASDEHSRICEQNERSFHEKRGVFDHLMQSHRSSLQDALQSRKPIELIKAAAGLSFTGIFARPRRPSDPPAPIKAAAGREDAIWQNGMEGEAAVLRRMEESLDDSWTCFQGFHGAKGEIDFVLVGPDGIAAIEVKNINGRITCRGSEWRRDRYDAYGNVVESGIRIADRGGRSPSRQLLDSVDWLASGLLDAGKRPEIYSVVVLSHERSHVHEVEELEINELVHLRDWDASVMVKRIGEPLRPGEVTKVAKAIERMHQRNTNSRSMRKARHSEKAVRPKHSVKTR